MVYFVQHEETQNRRDLLLQSEELSVSSARNAFEKELQPIISDLNFISQLMSDKTFAQMEYYFSLLAGDKKHYDKIRFLSLTGNEVVRVNYRNNQVTVVPPSELQSKKDRYYFQDTLKLGRGEVYISPLDLNVEYAEIERPLRPMIRFGQVVFDENGKKRGIIVLNFLALDMLKNFRKHADNVAGELRMANAQGYWLSHELWEKEWGFMFDREDRVQHEYPEEWKTILKAETGQFETENGLFTYTTVHPIAAADDINQTPYFWKIFARVPADFVRGIKYDQVIGMVIVVGPIYVLLIIVCALLAMSRVNRLRVLQDLHESETNSRAIIDLSRDGIISVDQNGNIATWNPAAEKIFGYFKNEVCGQPIKDIIVGPSVLQEIETWQALLAEKSQTGLLDAPVEHTVLTRTGKALPVEMTFAVQDTFRKSFLTIFIRDLSNQKNAEARDRLAKVVFDETHEGICICDEQRKIMIINKSFTTITGYRLRKLKGKDPNFMAAPRYDSTFFKDMWQAIHERGHWSGELWNVDGQGNEYPTRCDVSVMRSKEGKIQNYIWVLNDISEQKKEQESLHIKTHFDALTGLPNRILFLDRLRRAVAESKRTGEVFALLFIDLNFFTVLKGIHGHAVSDQMLIEVAHRLKDAVRESDSVARLGNDQYTILWRNLTGENDLDYIKNKVKTALEAPWKYDGMELNINGSIGYALCPQDGETAEELMRKAEQSMFLDKPKKVN